ncbi:MAG: alpha/beta hydrolase, partial [Planctomycetes bacterium]|nr:alpha/beta hydrolase [Planctomycetota bacterium]
MAADSTSRPAGGGAMRPGEGSPAIPPPAGAGDEAAPAAGDRSAPPGGPAGARAPRASPRRLLLGALAYAAICCAVVGGRGLFLAHLIGGRYRLASFLVESIALLALLGSLRLLESGIRWSLRRLFRPRRWWQHALEKGIYVAVMLLGLGPFILATLFLHPQRISCRGTPLQMGLAYREVLFESRGRTLSGWFVPAPDESAPVVLVTHGLNANKENFLLPVSMLHELGFAAFIFDMPGHGDSEGWTITFGALESDDVLAAHDWIARELPGRRIHALGYSMGGAAVVRAAAEHGIFDRLVIDSSFSAMEDVALSSVLRPIGPLARPVWTLGCFWGRLWTGFDFHQHRPGDLIAKIAQRPLLLIHGLEDHLIPSSESVRLREAAGGRAELWLVEGAGHAESILAPGYESRLGEFFARP